MHVQMPPLAFEPKMVPRIHKPELEAVWGHICDEPVVFTGCLESWRLHTELRARSTYEEKLAHLQELFGELPVEYLRLTPESKGEFHFPPDLRGDPLVPERISDVPFRAFADRLLSSLKGSGEYIYLQSNAIPKGSALHQALDPTVLYWLREKHYWPRIWIGSNACITHLHYDEFGNFICMADGYKRITMFPPDVLPYMYHMPFDRMLERAQASAVRLLHADLDRFPRFRTALQNAHVAVLGPGDVLLIPPMWWHHVESYGMNVMVNNWLFLIPIEQLVAFLKSVSRGIRFFHGRPPAEREVARAVFRREAFGFPHTGPEAPSKAKLDSATLGLLEETRALLAPLHSIWRRWHAQLYEHFAFQLSGDPFPMLPGELDALLERRASSDYLYPNAHEAEQMLREYGELRF